MKSLLLAGFRACLIEEMVKLRVSTVTEDQEETLNL